MTDQTRTLGDSTGTTTTSGSSGTSAAGLSRAPAPDIMTQSSAAKPTPATSSAATSGTEARSGSDTVSAAAAMTAPGAPASAASAAPRPGSASAGPIGTGADSGSDTLSAAAAMMTTRGPGSPTVNEPAAFTRVEPIEASLEDQHRAIVPVPPESRTANAKMVGAVLAGAVAAAAIPFLLSRRNAATFNAAPRLFARSDRAEAEVEEMVLIDRPARVLYDFWRDFTNLSEFMENVRSVTRIDDRRSHWVIAAPAGTKVEFDSMIVDDVPGSRISWHSMEGADVRNRGRVEFIDTAGGRGTLVRTVIHYDPPAGTAGRLVAKLFQREPAVQARRDLRRFKQLMETGTVDAAA